MLYEMTSVIVRHGGYIHSVDILERGDRSAIFWELYGVDDEDALIADLESLEVVTGVERVPSMLEVFGKRIIVIGGGAQVGQVALGAIAEADRHNIRGEKISIDTIPIVGEENLANAVRAVPRLPRAVALVLAGALMGGEITRAVREVREKGVLVVSLNMAGSAPRRRRPGRQRPRPGRRHDGHGRRQDRPLRHRPPARPRLLASDCDPAARFTTRAATSGATRQQAAAYRA